MLQPIAAGEHPWKESGSFEMLKLNQSKPKRIRAQDVLHAESRSPRVL